MRIRQVKPEFWSDADMAELPPAVRLTYVGLWCIADDAGWLVVDVPQIAHDLYGYDGRTLREKTLVEHLYRLQEAGKVVVELCGHAVIPTLPDHQRQSAATRRVETVKKEHARCIAADFRGTQRNAADFRSGTVGNGKERNVSVTVDDGQEIEEPSEFQRRMAAVAK